VILMSIAGLFAAINTFLRKAGLMSRGEQANLSDRNDGE
jgi:F0F1-type ATP synthase assembly protein I